MDISLENLVTDFAWAIQVVDTEAYNQKYNVPGIGSFDEPEVVRLVTLALRQHPSGRYEAYGLEVQYPGCTDRCDFCLGTAGEWQWAVEIKPVRFLRSNGDLEDSTIKRLLSPYEEDGSALSDARRLASSDLYGSKAVLLYGFDYPDRGRKPARLLDPAVAAFELLAHREVALGPRHTATFAGLRHPWHKGGRVFAWQVHALPTR